MDDQQIADASRRLLSARDSRRSLAPLSATHPGLDSHAAYRIARLNFDALTARGERAAGRKIGFTNRGIWDEYKVYEPIWAHMYASTVRDLENGSAEVPVAAFCDPRIEPEIMVRFARAPEIAEPAAIADCLEWIAHGYEIVDCHFPDWKFAVSDTIADFGLHAALFVGKRVSPSSIPDVVATLSNFRIELSRDGTVVDRGQGSNVLDGPLHAIAHLMKVLSAQDSFPPIGAGEIITTGTLTAAWPVAAGERWQSQLDGVGGLSGAALHFV